MRNLKTKLSDNAAICSILESLLEKNVWYTKDFQENYEAKIEKIKSFAPKMDEERLLKMMHERDCKVYLFYSYFLCCNSKHPLRGEVESLLSVPAKKFSFEEIDQLDPLSAAKLYAPKTGNISDIVDSNPVFKRLVDRVRDKKEVYLLGDTIFDYLPGKKYWHHVEDRLAYIRYTAYNAIQLIESERVTPVLAAKEDSLKNLPQKFPMILMNIDSIFDLSLDLITQGVANLTDDGMLIIEEFSLDFMSGKECYELRRFLVQEDLLEAIYESSMGRYYVLNRNKKTQVFYYLSENHSIEEDFYKDNVQRIDLKMFEAIDYSFDKNAFESLLTIPFNISETEKYERMSHLLERYADVPHQDNYGKVFTEQYLSKDFESFVCPLDRIQKQHLDPSYRKVTDAVLVFSPNLKEMNPTYVQATQGMPVYFDRTYWVVCSVNENRIDPGYIYYLFYAGILKKAMDAGGDYLGSYYDVIAVDSKGTPFFLDTYYDKLPEHTRRVDKRAWGEWYLFSANYLPIPVSKEEQKRRVEDSRLMWKVMADREAAREKLFEEKKWLNEQHIRNIKHRLRDEMTPIQIGLKRLQKLMRNSGGVLREQDIFGKSSGQTVGNVLDNLLCASVNIEQSLLALTEDPHFSAKERMDIYALLQNYRKENVFPSNFQLEIVPLREYDGIQIECSRKDMYELLDYLVENAGRHGFTDSARTDYCVRIELSIVPGGMCCLVVANNGKPMSERAEEIYFVRGSYAEDTGNSGIGGARVKDIVEYFGGEVRLCTDNSDFPVKIEMLFPIVNI